MVPRITGARLAGVGRIALPGRGFEPGIVPRLGAKVGTNRQLVRQ